MRRAAESFLLLLMACGVFCFVIGWAEGLNPTIVSGTVIDWTTGKPVPHVLVYFKLLNGGKEAGYTDEKGRFTAAGPRGDCCFLLVWDQRFGPLLQAQFGGGFVDVRPGWWHSGIVIPVIPSTELSGHVYGDDGKPLAGCDVFALTGNQEYSQGLASVDLKKTDKDGKFSFTTLGADRYFLAAPCLKSDDDDGGIREDPFKGWKVRKAWQTAMSEPIVLLPGARKQGVELRLRHVPQYTVGGSVLLPVHPKSILDYDYATNEVTAATVDPAVSTIGTSLNGDACEWDGRSGKFRCDFLQPGAYRLRFRFSYDGYDESTNVIVSVKADDMNMTVRMPEPRPKPLVQKTGYLRLHRVCDDPGGHGWSVFDYGPPVRLRANFWELYCRPVQTWPVAPGTHVLFSASAWYHNENRQRKIDALLGQHGVSVTVQPGQTVDVTPTFLTTDEVMKIALDSLH